MGNTASQPMISRSLVSLILDYIPLPKLPVVTRTCKMMNMCVRHIIEHRAPMTGRSLVSLILDYIPLPKLPVITRACKMMNMCVRHIIEHHASFYKLERRNDENWDRLLFPILMRTYQDGLRKNVPEGGLEIIVFGRDNKACGYNLGDICETRRNGGGQLSVKRLPLPKCRTPITVGVGPHQTLAIPDDEGRLLYSVGGRGACDSKGDEITLPYGWRSRQLPTTCKEKVVQVTAGDYHAAAVDEGGHLYTWGAYQLGQSGRKESNECHGPPKMVTKLGDVVGISAGAYHTASITEDGELHTFGYNAYGQLGLGPLDPTSCRIYTCPTRVSLPTAVWQVACGGNHSVAVTVYGELYSWGQNNKFQLGHGGNQHEYSPRLIDTLAGTRVSQASCGRYHTAILTPHGMYTFGTGPLGHANEVVCLPTKVDGITQSIMDISAGGRHTAAVTTGGKVITFGDGTKGQLGRHLDGEHDGAKPAEVELDKWWAVQVFCGDEHTVVLGMPKRD